MIQRNDFPFQKLSIEERMLLVGDIWDSIVAEQDAVPVTDAERAEIQRRWKAYQANPNAVTEWAHVKAYVQRRLKEHRSGQ